MHSFIEGMIEKHRRDFDPNCMRDFTDYYLQTEKSNDPDKISGLYIYDIPTKQNSINI